MSIPARQFQLNLQSVSRDFGARRVLQSVSASVGTGQVMVITGPNGSGKSTLVKIAARLLRPSSGIVSWALNGRDLAPETNRNVLGLVSPDLTLYEELSAEENLTFFSRVRGIPVSAGTTDEILERYGLGGRGRDLVRSYSSGMRQRLKYAFAMLHDPPLLMLDEPTANLDARGIELVREIIESSRSARCIVIATNEPEEVRYGDFVIDLGT